MEIRISKLESRSFLQIGSEEVEIDRCEIKSSSDGKTELLISISGLASIFEMSANLKA